MKYLKNYYYVFEIIGFVLIIRFICYLLGNTDAINLERVIIYLIGGLIVGTFGNVCMIYQKKKELLHESE